MREIIKLNNLYIGYELPRPSYYQTYEGAKIDKYSFLDHSYFFGDSRGFSKEEGFFLNRVWHSSVKDLVVIPVIRYKNIFEYIKEKNLFLAPSGSKTNAYTEGTFCLGKLFCKEEPVIEFFFLKHLKIKQLRLKVCSESLFAYLFREI